MFKESDIFNAWNLPFMFISEIEMCCSLCYVLPKWTLNQGFGCK